MAVPTMRRRLPIINGFVSVPDDQIMHPTTLTPAEVLALVDGSELVILLEPGGGKQQFIEMPEFDYAAPEDWYTILRAAANL